MTTLLGKGSQAKKWLESKGLVATVPAIRSSDYESILSCPFQYYLSRRLGLVSALRWSAALNRGTWFHHRLELFREPREAAVAAMNEALDKKLEELEELCAVRGIIGGERQKIMDRERKDMLMAMSWFEAIQVFHVPGKGSVVDYLSKPWFEILGTEVVAEYNHPDYGRLLAQFDILLYHKDQDKLFIVDAKTCAGSTIDRLRTCPIEFQPQHYLYILKWLLSAGVLTDKYGEYGVSEKTKIGGMIHIAVQKPTIEFGMGDRDFSTFEHEISRGPRKGQIELRKTYSGEPKWENYRDRCKRWILSQEEYEDKKPERNSDPPVNFSLTYARPFFTLAGALDYHSRLQFIRHYQRADAAPGRFPMSANHLKSYGRMSPFTPFYLMDPKDWPGILLSDGFIREDRDLVTPDLSA